MKKEELIELLKKDPETFYEKYSLDDIGDLTEEDLTDTNDEQMPTGSGVKYEEYLDDHLFRRYKEPSAKEDLASDDDLDDFYGWQGHDLDDLTPSENFDIKRSMKRK